MAERAFYAEAVGVNPGESFLLSAAVTGSHDRMFVFEGDPLNDTVEVAIGFEWEGQNPSFSDVYTVLFIDDVAVTRWAQAPTVFERSEGELVGVTLPANKAWIEIDLTNPIFQVQSKQPDGPITVCYETCE